MARNRPRFEGQAIKQTTNKVTGDVGHPALNVSLHAGDEVTIVLTGRVAGINHRLTDAGLQRIQTIKVEDGYFVADLDAADLLHKLHGERTAELDKLLGTSSLDFEGKGDEPD